RGNPQAIEGREGPGIQRVAAQLLAGNPRAVNETDADAGAGEHERGNAPGWPRADDEDVGRHVPTRPTRLTTLPAPVPAHCFSSRSQGSCRAPPRSRRAAACSG